MTLQYGETQGHTYLCMLNNGEGDGFFESRTFKDRKEFKPPDARIWFTDAGGISPFVNERLAQREHVYVGVAARQKNKGDKAGLLYSNFLWAELDFKTGGEAAARERLAAYPMPPTMIVHSGGGLHLYWLIERFDLTTEANRTLFERALKQLCDDLGGDRAATDCTRILRLPGTWNVKAHYGEPRPVVLEFCNATAAPYPLEVFPLLPEPQKAKQVTAPKPYSTSGLAPDDNTVLQVAFTSAVGGKIRRLYSGDTSDYRGNHSSADQALCCYLAYYCGESGHSQVESLWRNSNLWRDKGDEKHSSDGRSYCAMTVDKAYEGRTEFYCWNPTARAGRTNIEGTTRPETLKAEDADLPDGTAPGIESDGAADTAEKEEIAIERTPDSVSEAKAFVTELWPQLAGDPGAAYSEEALQHFALLRSVPAEWERLKPLFKQYKVTIGTLKEAINAYWKKQIPQEAAALPDGGAGVRSLLEKPEEKPLCKVGDVLFDVPLSARSLLIPRGYTLRDTGIEGSEGAEIANTPVLIVRVLSDIQSKATSFVLLWRTARGWKDVTVARAVTMNSQQVLTLAENPEFPVNSNTARDLVKWLADFEDANRLLLPRQDTSEKMGWQDKDGELGFLCGHQHITPNGEVWEAGNPEPTPLVFRADDIGSEQLAAAHTRKGTFERWQQVTAKLHRYPHVQMALLASFIPAILQVVESANLIIDLSNRTSTGKTTCLRVAASVWGNPDTQQGNSIINTWNMTRVWGERTATMLNGIPMFLDDTKQAKNPAEVGKFIYDLYSGSARGRGNVKGKDALARWRTVLLSTGEAPATSFDEAGGARTRCICVTRSPFGKDTEETAKFVRALHREVCDNYGHAGIRFVQWLLQQRSQWPEFAQQYREFIKSFHADSGSASRMAEHLALFQIVGLLLHQSGTLSGDVVALSPELTRAIMQEAEEASGELRALRHVLSWAAAHENQFAGREKLDSHGDKVDPLVWAGRWEVREDSDLCFLPNILNNVLQEGKFDPNAIRVGWRAMGWLDCGTGPRDTKNVRVKHAVTHCVAIKYEAIYEAENDGEPYKGDAEYDPQDASETTVSTATSDAHTNATPQDGLTPELREMIRKARKFEAFNHETDKSVLLQVSPRVEVANLNLFIRQHADSYAQAWQAQEIDTTQESLKYLNLCEKFIREDEEGFKG